jgi:hypothetical protein
MLLHAEVLEVPGDGDRAPVRAVAPLPRDLEVVLTKLRRFAAPRRSPCD